MGIFGGSINIKATCWTFKDREKGSGPSAQPEGTGSLRIQAIRRGLITCEDILIKHQILELPRPSCPHALSNLQPPSPPHIKQKNRLATLHSQGAPQGGSVVRGADERV